MKIIILGAGQVGASSADVLSGEANDVTLVDIDANQLRQLQDRLDIRTVAGNAAYPDVLSRAGAEDADLLLAVTNSDEINMVACTIASTMFDTPTKMARIRAPEYLAYREIFDGDAFPIDVLISPEQILTNHIMRLVEYPSAIQVLDFAGGRIQLAGVRAVEGGPMVGHPLSELKDHMPTVDARVAAIYRTNKVITPTANTVVKQKDEVFFVAARENINNVMSEMREVDNSVRRVMLAGGGNIGLRLASNLESKGYSVKIIERNPSSAEGIADRLDSTVVLLGDAADEELLSQENIDTMDVFCAVTNNDEANILSAMLAKRLGARRVMALINRAVYVDLFEDIDLLEKNKLDVVISPRLATVGSILAHIRRGDIVAVHSLRGGKAEAIEAIAHGDRDSSRVVGRGVRELPLPPGTGIGAILRNDEVLIAHKDTVIESEDHVILFVEDKKYIPEVERLFQVDVMYL
jgi:trk system potassium uptake protein TrkA